MVAMARTSLMAAMLDSRCDDKLATTSCCCSWLLLHSSIQLADVPSSSASGSDIALPSFDSDAVDVADARSYHCSSLDSLALTAA